MTTPPPPKLSKPRDIGKAIQHGYDRLKQAIQPSSRVSTSPASSGTLSRSTPTQSPLSHGQVSTVSTNPELTTLAKLKETGNIAWSGLAKTLRVLEKSAEAFPPLKLAVGGLVECLDVVQAAATNNKDYQDIASELTTMADTLNQYLCELGLEEPSSSAARIALAIEDEVAHIDKKQARSKGRRMISSAQDKEDVIKRYRRIEGLFRQLLGDISLQIWKNTNEQRVTTLLRGMSPIDDARYNSSYSTTIKRRGCTAETRENVQVDLQDWVRDPNAAKVYWMNGMAGTGKTTIAYSLCEWLEANQRLGASFFCSRISSSCRNVNSIVPTIAYQLARYSPVFQSTLCKILKDDPDASKLNVVRQFEKLVREPLLTGQDAIPEGVVVVIDALDECDDDYGVRLVLGTLLRLAADLPLKFFVTSRPEPAIRDNMLSPGQYSPVMLHLHDIEQSIVEEDIKKYLTEALNSLAPPPSNEEIEQLSNRAGKLFIYAATIVRYILPGGGSANSIARLNKLLKMDSESQSTDREGFTRRYKKLDDLYTTILIAAFNEDELEKDEIKAMRLVLRTAVCAKEPMTALTMASLLNLYEAQIMSALKPLRSVLHVSEAGGLISALHTSFPDYMLDRLRSGEFHCDRPEHSDLLAHRCFDIMEEQLQFNICGIDSSYTFDKDVPDLENRIETYISPTLFYTSQYWGEHLQLACPSHALHDKLAEFLTCRLLFWMEVLNLKLCIVKGVSILLQAENWLSAAKALTGALKQVTDARDFVTRFAAGACGQSTPHIYLSALPFCAKSNSVYAHYWRCTRGLLDVRGTAISRRDKAAQATWMTNSAVLSVAFSPDGTRIASGSSDHTVRVRDVRTGGMVAGPFKGHKSTINSIAFSPNGTFIASGSDDRTIQVWDGRTGDTITEPLEGHTNSINSVAFSPDGLCIVSGSSDATVRLWAANTGNTIAVPFEGHTGWVNSVAFSPSGACIASGASDRTIRVWDARTGDTLAGPFNGHTDGVYSIAFSLDGTQIFSGSSDRTIRVWGVWTGGTIAGPFEGHEGPIYSVAPSPDGTRIVSCSSDRTIRVWDPRTGDTVTGPLEGHTNTINSVAFSPDGTRLASGSFDYTIRMWDAYSNDVSTGSFRGHTDWVNSVAFSPDGRSIVSGSSDHTTRVWDACTGDSIAGPFKEHNNEVHAVAFSPDGTRIVSASDDQMIQMRDACTGDTIAGPFKGHAWLINSVAFSPDCKRIASGSSDETLRVWDVCTGDTVAGPFKGHTGPVNSVAFSPDGGRIVSGSSDKTIRVWDICTGNTVAGPFEGHTGWIKSVGFSPDGMYVVSGSGDWTIRVWDARIGSVIAGPLKGHTGWVNSVAFSPDGTRIVSGSADRTIRMWDARTGDIIAGPFEVHTNSVNSVAFSPDSTRIVSGSSDKTIRVWDICFDNTVAREFEGRSDPKFNMDGWITAEKTPLFWVSPDFHSHVPHPLNTLVIGPQGAVYIGSQSLNLGERWSECYICE